jgi:hypothetical protein
MSRIFALLVLIMSLLGSQVQSQQLHFSATGCGPYSPEEEPLLEHHIDLVNRDGQSDFLVHLGDVVSGSKRKWPESQYEKVASILRKSKRPTFVVLGDNEWNDLEDPTEGLEYWDRHFRNFEKHFPRNHSIEKQSARTENFAFVSKGVLVIGLNLVGGKVHDRGEWQTRLQQNADWVQEQLLKHANDARAAVLLAQARPSPDHEAFFKPLAEICRKWVKPVLYLHADGHVWQLEKGWRAPNILRVQTDQVKLNPPVLITVTENAEEPFVFDRRRDIGSQRELLIDDSLIDSFRDTQLRVHRPVPKEVALTCDAPWEGNISAYYTFFQDGDLYRVYYRGAHFDEVAKKPAHAEFTCYAESRDGIEWVKPKLGLVEFAGSKENNIILSGEGTHNFAPFLDANPACSPDAKYKALAGDTKGLKAYRSADGIHWTLMQDKPVITKGDFDSQNLAFWHPIQKRYLAFHRKGREGVRDIMMSVSTNFLAWNDPRFLEYGDAPKEHLYTNAIQPYFRAPQLLVGFPTRFQPANQQVEPIFMSSRDGLSFRRWPEAIIPIEAPKDRDGNRSNYMTSGLLEIPGRKDELSVFATEAYYTGQGSRVRRFVYRTDGFVSLHADSTKGECLTKPFTFSGNRLDVNFRSVDQGTVRVEIQDRTGKAIAGYSLQECEPMLGDSISHTVRWIRGSGAPQDSVGALANQPIRLKLELTNADLFSFQFANP